VVLDNAGSVEQIRPLLPGAPSCLVLVTSRDSLAGLVARHGAQRLNLDSLPLTDAVALLRVLIGKGIDAEPDAAVVLAGQCVRLPLALRVAAELAAGHPATSLTGLVGELADQQRRLDLLDAGDDPRTAVRAVFSWSYQHLPAEEARMFRLIGLHPGPDLDLYAAAALVDIAPEQVQNLLSRLVRAHLIAATGSRRYGMHDLLRAYSTDLATAEDSEPERRAALARMLDHYLATSAAAMDTLYPAEQHRRPRIPSPATPTPPVADRTAAQDWLDSERANLAASCAHAAAHGWPGHAARLASTLFRYLDTGGHYSDALTIYTFTRHAACQAGDPAAEACALTNLGQVHARQGRYEQAAHHLQQAVALCRETGDPAAEADALTILGVTCGQQGRYEHAAHHLQQAVALCREISDRLTEARALDILGLVYGHQGRSEQAAHYHQQSLALCRAIGYRIGEAHSLTSLGGVYRRRGRYSQAIDHHQQALALFREMGDRAGEATVLGNLSIVYGRQGHYKQAIDHEQQALALSREMGSRNSEAHALNNLGDIYRRQGRYEQATSHLQQALSLFREIRDRGGEADTLNSVGENYYAIGRLGEAQRQHTTALDLAVEIGDRYEQARAHNGLAHIHYASGDESDVARHHWREALTLYTDLGVPEADDVQAHLTALDQAGHPPAD